MVTQVKELQTRLKESESQKSKEKQRGDAYKVKAREAEKERWEETELKHHAISVSDRWQKKHDAMFDKVNRVETKANEVMMKTTAFFKELRHFARKN